MNEIQMVKLAELRSKLSAIPGKLIVTFLLTAGLLWNFSWDTFKENLMTNIGSIIIMYGLVSYVWLCVKLTHNWIIGIIFAVILLLIVSFNAEKLGSVVSTVLVIALCFGGLLLDIFYIVRYFTLKRRLLNSISDGYDYYEEYEESSKENREEHDRDSRGSSDSPGFFFGCDDERSIKRRYKELCKVYHPDNGNGSAEVFNKITEEYNLLIAKNEN